MCLSSAEGCIRATATGAAAGRVASTKGESGAAGSGGCKTSRHWGPVGCGVLGATTCGWMRRALGRLVLAVRGVCFLRRWGAFTSQPSCSLAVNDDGARASFGQQARPTSPAKRDFSCPGSRLPVQVTVCWRSVVLLRIAVNGAGRAFSKYPKHLAVVLPVARQLVL